MTTPTLKTIELTRSIRDRHYEALKNMTPSERIAFYRHQAQELHSRLHIPHLEQYTVKTDIAVETTPYSQVQND